MAMIVARADDQKAAHREAVAEIGRVLDGLRHRLRWIRLAPLSATCENGTRVAMDYSW